MGSIPRHGRSAPHAHRVALVDEIPPGERRIVLVEGRSIGVFNVRGTFYAIRNLCPHQQAPLCEGRLLGTTLPSRPGEYVYGREGEILRCPWHGWEFDVTTGRSLYDPGRCRVRAYPVTVDTGDAGRSDLPQDLPDARGQVPSDGVLGAEGAAPGVERFDVSVDGEYVFVHV